MNHLVLSMPNPMNKLLYIRENMLSIFFPFTLSQLKTGLISDDVLLEYEKSVIKLSKQLDKGIKLLAAKENRELDEEFYLEKLKEFKNTV